MKLVFVYIIIFALASTSSVMAMETIEEGLVAPKSKKKAKKDAENSLLEEYKDYLLDERAWHEDCASRFSDLTTEFHSINEAEGEIEAIQRISKRLGIDPNQSLEGDQIIMMLSNKVLYHENKMRHINNLIKDYKKITQKEISVRSKLLEFFDGLFREYTCNIHVELQKNRRYANEIAGTESEDSQEILYHHQMQLQFLRKLYQRVKPNIKDKDVLARIEIDKNFRDIIEGKASFITTFNSGMETNPTDNDSDQVQAYWKKIGKRNSILIYFKRSVGSKEVLGKRNPIIDWGRVTLDNIDDVPGQIKYFLPNISTQTFNSNLVYLEVIRKKLKEELSRVNQKKIEEKQRRKEARRAQMETEKEENTVASLIDVFSLSPKDEYKIPTPIKLNNNNEVKEALITPTESAVVKKEKDRDARRKEWERLQDETKRKEAKQQTFAEEEMSSDDSSDTCHSLSKTTKNTLSQLFGFKHAKMISWNELVSAWKELRRIIDGEKDPKPRKMSGSVRTFDGGPDLHSFNLHKPHANMEDAIFSKTMKRIAEHFQNKFQWTLEKLKKHGFDPEIE